MCCPGVDFFLVKKLFYAFAGVRGADVREERECSGFETTGQITWADLGVVMHGKREFNAGSLANSTLGHSAVPGYEVSDTALSS